MIRVSLRRLFIIQAAFLLASAGGCLLFPPGWFGPFGFDLVESPAALICVRTLGAMFAALSLAYVLQVVRPRGEHNTRFVAVAANGLVGGVLWLMIYRGALAALPLVGKVIITGVAGASLLFAVLLLLARGHAPQAPGLAAALAPTTPAPTGEDQSGEDGDRPS